MTSPLVLPFRRHGDGQQRSVTVDASRTGQYELDFSGWPSRAALPTSRYLVDGNPGANVGNPFGSAVAQASGFTGNSYNTGWQELTLSRLLTLSQGTHAVAVQILNDATAARTMLLASPTLRLVGYDKVNDNRPRTVCRRRAVFTMTSPLVLSVPQTW